MPGYTVHAGSTVKFSTGWDTIFGAGSGKGTTSSNTRASSAKRSKISKKRAAKKAAAPKKRPKATRSRRAR